MYKIHGGAIERGVDFFDFAVVGAEITGARKPRTMYKTHGITRF
jgi:hypothetical protein